MKIGIVGQNGRVGQILVKELQSGAWDGLEFAGGIGRSDDPAPLFETSDAVIDFTQPEGTEKYLDFARDHNTAMIIGTTGMSKAQEQKLTDTSKTVPIIYAANMSIAVNMLLALTEYTAAKLGPEYDIEIVEAHHKHKVDAPSGTALELGKAAAKGRDVNLDDVSDRARDGFTGEREKGKIGFAALRGGDAAGEHTVYFLGDGERLELKQQASDRSLYAKGALKAALWVEGKDPGLYSMRDVLGL